MSHIYSFHQLKEAILFNSHEVMPNDPEQIDKEIETLVNAANASGEQIRHYIGYEVSGLLHFANTTYQMMKVAKLQAAGVKCHIWLADYHTWINKKLDGKISTIRNVAKNYFAPIFKKTLESCGGNAEELVILYAKEEYFKFKGEDNLSFWDCELECESKISLSRVLRSLSIAGKEAGQDIDYQVTRYPGMQAADVFWLQTHLVQAGLDQRKIYVSTRDIALKIDPIYQLKIGGKSIKPIAMSASLLLGLDKPKETVIETKELTIQEQQNLMYLQQEVAQSGTVNLDEIDQTVARNTLELITEHHAKTVEVNKMSKSKPDSCIFVHDSVEEIRRKLKKAYCPMPRPEEQTLAEIETEQLWNPMLDWSKKMIFPSGRNLVIERKPEWGGDVTYNDYETLKDDYFTGKIHPMDLKTAVGNALIDWFEIIRDWGDENPEIIELVIPPPLKTSDNLT